MNQFPLYLKCAFGLVYFIFFILFLMDMAYMANSSPHNKNVSPQVGRHGRTAQKVAHAKPFRNIVHTRHSPDYSNDMPAAQALNAKEVAVLYQLQKVTQAPLNNEEGHQSVGPSFVEPSSRTIVTRAGQTASLSCVVRNIGDRQVSWIRGKDLHVLSSGLIVFATDSRVSVTASGSAWTLTISYSQPRDGGSYACQINTQPPIASWFNLTVIEAKANIEGPSTLYVQEGSNISLSCIIKEELVIPGLVLWYHGEALVPRDSNRIKVTTKVTNITTSHLNISGATTDDSGNYSCWPSSGKQDTVLVHVIQGDPPAAMQHGNSSPSPCLQLRAFLTLITWLTPALIIPGWLT